MKIYIDLLLIQDVIIISTILYIVSKLINIKISIYRLITISFFSSIISIIILIKIPILFDNFFTKMILSFFIIKYGFKLKDVTLTVQKIILFWTVTLLTGGINIASSGNVVITIFVLIIICISIISYKKRIKSQVLLESMTCFISFNYKGKQYYLKSLVDTGHDVKSIYGEDVIFIREKLLKIEGDNKNRLVRYKTISGVDNRNGIKINKINISYGDSNFYSSAVIVSTPNIKNDYDAIVGYDLIMGGKEHGDTCFNKAEGKEIIS